MKSKIFEVPTELLADFSELLSENELVNEIQGSTEDDEIIIEVSYSAKQKAAIHELEDWLEDALDELDDDDEDSDDDDESEDE